MEQLFGPEGMMQIVPVCVRVLLEFAFAVNAKVPVLVLGEPKEGAEVMPIHEDVFCESMYQDAPPVSVTVKLPLIAPVESGEPAIGMFVGLTATDCAAPPTVTAKDAPAIVSVMGPTGFWVPFAPQ